MEFRELGSVSLKDLFVREMETCILSGRLAVGEKLPTERELAQQMKVSRAVINGGISELAAKGFLDVVPRKGVFVADYKNKGTLDTLLSILQYSGGMFDPEMLDSINHVRNCLERDIAMLAAENHTPQELDALKTQLQRLEECEEPHTMAELTFEFMHLLTLASHNLVHPLMMTGFAGVYIPLLEALYRQGVKKERLALLWALVRRIEERDAAGAADAASDIIGWSRTSLEQYYTPGRKFRDQGGA
ncbi:GntR family transcriptional regulator [Ruminococcaceae bacterium OttesenSCG-928-O06]|nr:GntR family transcriptional regulator [Ruminococcaceae bacterium OttesenSCG-928-O06]